VRLLFRKFLNKLRLINLYFLCFEDKYRCINLQAEFEDHKDIQGGLLIKKDSMISAGKITLRTVLTSLVLGVLLICTAPVQAEVDVAKGESLFKANCASCHKLNQKLIGPALTGVVDKYDGDIDWLKAWIRNNQQLVKAGDARALAIYNEYDKKAMNIFPNFTDEDIESILEYIENPPVEEAAAVEEEVTGDIWSDPSIYYAMAGFVALLSLIALVMVILTAILVVSVRAKDASEPVTVEAVQELTWSILRNKFVITVIALLVVGGGTTQLINAARGVSLHEGYMPEQPIKFSHKLHAGKYEIDCQYCHTGASKSKNAWVPSVNVCMNCHKGIQEGPNYGTEEIGKILKAYENKQAIEWVRIHNLPDHAYFNHAQHVTVGGIECQTCHGPVEEMEVVYQYSPLSMGWCINCHRETKVKAPGSGLDLTVEDIGGLDCARCHY